MEEAKWHLPEALRLHPEIVEAYLALERIFFAEGELDRAPQALRVVSRRSPYDPTPHYRMSMLYLRLGRA